MFSSNKNRTTVSHSIPNVVQVCKLLKYAWSTRTIYRNVCYLADYILPNKIWGQNYFCFIREERNEFFQLPATPGGTPMQKGQALVGNFVKTLKSCHSTILYFDLLSYFLGSIL